MPYYICSKDGYFDTFKKVGQDYEVTFSHSIKKRNYSLHELDIATILTISHNLSFTKHEFFIKDDKKQVITVVDTEVYKIVKKIISKLFHDRHITYALVKYIYKNFENISGNVFVVFDRILEKHSYSDFYEYFETSKDQVIRLESPGAPIILITKISNPMMFFKYKLLGTYVSATFLNNGECQ